MSDAPAFPGVADAPNLIPPPGNPRFPLLDSMRAIAALSVFAGHTVTGVISPAAHPTLVLWAEELANAGVAIFFLLSGFLLYRPFLTARRNRKSLRVGSYARRRFVRIVPAYWAALSIFIAAGFVGDVTGGNWWIFYGFGQIYSSVNIGHGIGVAWTLCIEVTFYAALPLFPWICAQLHPRRQAPFATDVVLLVALAGGSLAFRAHFSSFLQVATVSTLPGTFFWFALGMGAAIVSVRLEHRSAATPRSSTLTQLWPILSWIAGALLLVLLHQVKAGFLGLGFTGAVVLGHVLYGLIALCILLPAVFGEHEAGAVRRLLRVRALVWIGLISYGFYLYHTIVIAQLGRHLNGTSTAPRYAIVAVGSFLISLACAAASYYLLERPIMRWGRSARWRVGRPLRDGAVSGHELP